MSAENPIVWLGLVPAMVETKSGKNTPKPVWKVSRREVQEMNRKRKFSYGAKVSQAESQKVKQISIVLNTIDKFGPINTNKIRESSGLSWDSVVRTMNLLLEKEVVKMKQPKEKANNEKIYSLNRKKAVMYHENLFFHKEQVMEKGSKNKFGGLKNWQLVKKQLPDGWYEDYLEMVKSGNNNVGFHHMKIVMFNYITGNYCSDCFEKGTIGLPKHKDGVQYCGRCLEENTFEDRLLKNKSNTSGMKWKIKQEIFRMVKNRYRKDGVIV